MHRQNQADTNPTSHMPSLRSICFTLFMLFPCYASSQNPFGLHTPGAGLPFSSPGNSGTVGWWILMLKESRTQHHCCIIISTFPIFLPCCLGLLYGCEIQVLWSRVLSFSVTQMQHLIQEVLTPHLSQMSMSDATTTQMKTIINDYTLKRKKKITVGISVCCHDTFIGIYFQGKGGKQLRELGLTRVLPSAGPVQRLKALFKCTVHTFNAQNPMLSYNFLMCFQNGYQLLHVLCSNAEQAVCIPQRAAQERQEKNPSLFSQCTAGWGTFWQCPNTSKESAISLACKEFDACLPKPRAQGHKKKG